MSRQQRRVGQRSDDEGTEHQYDRAEHQSCRKNSADAGRKSDKKCSIKKAAVDRQAGA